MKNIKDNARTPNPINHLKNLIINLTSKFKCIHPVITNTGITGILVTNIGSTAETVLSADKHLQVLSKHSKIMSL